MNQGQGMGSREGGKPRPGDQKGVWGNPEKVSVTCSDWKHPSLVQLSPNPLVVALSSLQKCCQLARNSTGLIHLVVLPCKKTTRKRVPREHFSASWVKKMKTSGNAENVNKLQKGGREPLSYSAVLLLFLFSWKARAQRSGDGVTVTRRRWSWKWSQEKSCVSRPGVLPPTPGQESPTVSGCFWARQESWQYRPGEEECSFLHSAHCSLLSLSFMLDKPWKTQRHTH